MRYCLGDYELGQMKALLPQLNELYPESVAQKLRQLIFDAIQNGYLTDTGIYALLDLLPQVVAVEKEEITISDDTVNDDWPEWETAAAAKRKQTSLMLQQQLTHLLFMHEAAHKVVATRGQSPVKKAIQKIL